MTNPRGFNRDHDHADVAASSIDSATAMVINLQRTSSSVQNRKQPLMQ